MPGEAVVLPHPYSKGIRVIGHADLGKRNGNLIMAWSDRCAYVAAGATPGKTGPAAEPITPISGFAVIDMRDPAAPKVTHYLQDKGRWTPSRRCMR